MRTGVPLVARQAWYDRNPTDIEKSAVNESISPHAYTNRWSYTAPTGRKAYVELFFLKVERLTAATTAGRLYAYGYFTPSGGSDYLIALVSVMSNGVGDKDSYLIAQNLTLLPGDAIKAGDGDSSTAGLANFYEIAKVTEFDA
jgi:hypothetical protein